MAYSICNVYKPAGQRQLWQLTGDFKTARDFPLTAEDPLPQGVIAKGWGSVFRSKLNIAWLPPGTVFLRVVQLPVSDRAELVSMVEFQLEKLSPLPVTHIVWGMEVLPNPKDGQQTVIVLIAARQQVEDVLGQLEKQGYVADRLEAPALDHLLAAEIKEDGVWLYPPQDGTDNCWFAAWWYGGVLRHLGLIYLPDTEDRADVLRNQLTQMAWAGEIEGWLSGQPRWHLVADSVSASLWEPVIREVADDTVEVIPPHPLNRVAALTAQRAANAPREPSLLPHEHYERYRARFVDGLWMSSLSTIFLVYLLGTAVYFGYLRFIEYQLASAEAEVGALSGSYTNALQLQTQIKMLQEQQDFKYAALECWDAVARTLPPDLTLVSMSFTKERTLALFGTAPEESRQAILEFNAALKQVEFNKQPLFSKVNAPFIGSRQGNSVSWNFSCDLNKREAE